MNKDNPTVIGKIIINATEWYVAQYTPSNPNRAILSKQISSKVTTDLRYVEKSVFMMQFNTQNIWDFELGTQEGVNIPMWFFLGFQQRDRKDSQNINNDTFYRPPVTSAHCIIGVDNYPDSALLLNYDDDDFSRGHGRVTEAFKALTKDDILQL